MERNKLTAYALNEVSEMERKEIETYLESHPEDKKEVEQIKAVSAILRSEMAHEQVVMIPKFKKQSNQSFFLGLTRFRVFGLALSLSFVGVVSLLVLKEPKNVAIQGNLKNSVSVQDTVIPPPSTTGAMAPQSVAEDHNYKSLAANVNAKKMSRADVMGSALVDKGGPGGSGNGARHMGLLSHFSGKAELPVAKEATSYQEEYRLGAENDFILVSKESLSTFSIDVDTASYSNARRYLTSYNQIPPIDSIRTEEFVNYFEYDYTPPTSGHPIAVHMEATKSPWSSERAIIRVGLKAKELDLKDRPKSNLVFLIDVSGSMADENKLPLVKSALRTLTDQLAKDDRISMVVYAGQSGVILDSEAGSEKVKILEAIQNLSSGGSTNGEGGIRKAYELAQKNFISGGNNRVILASDGDFNVGVTSSQELLKIIKDKSEGGVFLTVLGFGMGNYKDARLEEISNKGQGNYFYIDNEKEANKVFVNQLAGTLFTIAKDVKVQVEFNPKLVHSYRLVGYENRMLNKEDFTNDKIDAGEMGAGHSVTALYEIEWAGKAVGPKLKYQTEEHVQAANNGFSDEILTAKIRYKKPQNSSSEFFEQPLKNQVTSINEASCSTRFSVAVASFSQWMRQSPHLKDFDSGRILDMAYNCLTTKDRKDSFKEEFLDLVKKAREIKK